MTLTASKQFSAPGNSLAKAVAQLSTDLAASVFSVMVYADGPIDMVATFDVLAADGEHFVTLTSRDGYWYDMHGIELNSWSRDEITEAVDRVLGHRD